MNQLLGKILTVVHTGQTGIVPRSPHKGTACDVRNCTRRCSLSEGTRVRFMGLLHIMMLGVKAAWGRG